MNLGSGLFARATTFAMQRKNDDGSVTPLTIPNHARLKSSTLRAICNQSGVTRADFLQAYGRAVATGLRVWPTLSLRARGPNGVPQGPPGSTSRGLDLREVQSASRRTVARILALPLRARGARAVTPARIGKHLRPVGIRRLA